MWFFLRTHSSLSVDAEKAAVLIDSDLGFDLVSGRNGENRQEGKTINVQAVCYLPLHDGLPFLIHIFLLYTI